jgi:uncharacterized heparinase superfamily protein
MQSLRWYIRRLGAMSPGEIAWRMRSKARDVVYRFLIHPSMRAHRAAASLASIEPDAPTGFSVAELPVGAWSARDDRQVRRWRETLTDYADRITQHRLSFFDLDDCNLGDPIDWHRDHKSGKASPQARSSTIDYRDFDVTGDCKFVWEPSRHHQLVVLGRAYRATGNIRYAETARDLLLDWIAANPFGFGMQWRSPLELAIRLINWVWTLDLMHPSRLFTGEFRRRVLESVWLHCSEIVRQFSRGSSANNHLIGEAAGVYIASRYFNFLPDAERWAREARRILCEQVIEQTHEDGGNREQAIGYHLFVLQFLLCAGVAARRSGDEFAGRYWETVERMFEFVAGMHEGGEQLPMFGDADDGYVLDLGDRATSDFGLRAIGALLFERADLAPSDIECLESIVWLFGADATARYASLLERRVETPPASRCFSSSGYYLLQCEPDGSRTRISVVFDCGKLGFRSIAAHGHADALSFVVRVGGRDLLVDPGTYDYFSFPEWRTYFRGTRAHNTIMIDDQDQSPILGSFMWGTPAACRCVAWEPSDDGGRVVGAHDGYMRLSDPVRHQRELKLSGDEGRLTIRDQIFARGKHAARMMLHFAEGCRVTRADGNRFVIELADGTHVLSLDRTLVVQVIEGGSEPGGGWVSRGYHRKSRTVTLAAEAVCAGDSVFDTTLALNVSNAWDGTEAESGKEELQGVTTR